MRARARHGKLWMKEPRRLYNSTTPTSLHAFTHTHTTYVHTRHTQPPHRYPILHTNAHTPSSTSPVLCHKPACPLSSAYPALAPHLDSTVLVSKPVSHPLPSHNIATAPIASSSLPPSAHPHRPSEQRTKGGRGKSKVIPRPARPSDAPALSDYDALRCVRPAVYLWHQPCMQLECF